MMLICMDHGNEAPVSDVERLEANVRRLLGLAQETFVTLQSVCGFGSRTTLYNLIAGKSATRDSRERLAAGLLELVRRRMPEFPGFAWRDLVEDSLAQDVGSESLSGADVSEHSFDESGVGVFASPDRKALLEAVRVLKEAADRARLDANRTGCRAKLFAVAVVQEQLGDEGSTLETLRRLIQVEGELGDSIAKARAMARAAWTAYRMSNLNEAKRFAEDTLRILERTVPVANADVRTWLKALDCMAMVLAHERQFREAARRLEQSLEKRMYLDCPLLRAATLYRLGRVYEMEGDWEMAHHRFDEALHLRRAHGAMHEAAKTAVHLARTCLATGRLDEGAQAIEAVQHQGMAPALQRELAELQQRLNGMLSPQSAEQAEGSRRN